MSDSACSRHRRPSIRAAPVVVLTLLTGCQLNQRAFIDALAHNPPVTTASVDAARTATPDRAPQSSSAKTGFRITSKDGSITHGPLYFQGPSEHFHLDDTHFALTRHDYTMWLHEAGSFLLNIALFPVHAVATPPGSRFESDGRKTKRVTHGNEISDARRSTDHIAHQAGVRLTEASGLSAQAWRLPNTATP